MLHPYGKIATMATDIVKRTERGLETYATSGAVCWKEAKTLSESRMMSVAVDFRVEHFAWVTFVPHYDARASSFFS